MYRFIQKVPTKEVTFDLSISRWARILQAEEDNHLEERGNTEHWNGEK